MHPAPSPILFIYPVIIAAAAAKRRQEMEEEEMSEYPENKSQVEWEYKIVRANGSAFKNSDRFHAVCAEEKRAGWILVEKFDDMRLRFKRPMSARENDSMLGFDPYRTRYGMAPAALAAIIVAALVGAIGVLVAFLIAFGHH